MGLETVKEEILRNAKKQEENLLAEAREQAAKLIAQAERKSEAFREKSEAETKKMIEMMKRQDAASADLEAKKLALEAKKTAVSKVFDEAREKLKKFDPKKKDPLLNKLLEKAGKEIDIGIIYCNKADAKLFKSYKTEHMDIIGGLIAENKDGTVRVDYSFGMMLESVRESQLLEISKILFE